MKKVRLFIGELPKNPCLRCKTWEVKKEGKLCPFSDCEVGYEYKVKQSILSQIKEVDLNKLQLDYSIYIDCWNKKTAPLKFEDFIEQELEINNDR